MYSYNIYWFEDVVNLLLFFAEYGIIIRKNK